MVNARWRPAINCIRLMRTKDKPQIKTPLNRTTGVYVFLLFYPTIHGWVGGPHCPQILKALVICVAGRRLAPMHLAMVREAPTLSTYSLGPHTALYDDKWFTLHYWSLTLHRVTTTNRFIFHSWLTRCSPTDQFLFSFYSDRVPAAAVTDSPSSRPPSSAAAATAAADAARRHWSSTICLVDVARRQHD